MSIINQQQEQVQAFGRYWVKEGAAPPEKSVRLAGVLYLSEAGWLLLNVPNALVRGAFSALDEPGIELPLHNDRLNAHISVMRPDEIEEIGGPDTLLKDRGRIFHYTLGPTEIVTPEGWSEMSKCWFIKVDSPELRQLRKSYGLTPLPKMNEYDFHITIAVRKKKVLQDNDVAKTSEYRLPETDEEKELAAAGHGIRLCKSCGVKIGSCRCLHGGSFINTDHNEVCKDCDGEVFKEAEEAEGIPSRKDYGDLTKVPVNKLLDLIIQKHKAERAGEHFDFRFGDPSGLHSWATRKELPEPGKRIALFQQPIHSHKYKDFEGTIPSGQYGAGTVEKHREGQLIITKMHPGMIHFTMASGKHPERFALMKPEKWGEKDWLLVNTTPTEKTPYEKVHYKKIPAAKVDNYLDAMQHGDSMEAKVDGASSLIKLLKDGVEVMSYRTSKQTGRPILHTEKLLGGGKQLNIPPHLVGSVLKGETYGVRQGKRPGSVLPGEEVIPPQELGGILNSSLAKSLTDMKDRGIKLKNMVYDIQQHGNESVDWSKVPRGRRREMMQDILQHLPPDIFHASESADTPEAAKEMWAKIKGGKHPLTREGAVIWPQSGTPLKAKLTEDADVHISNVFPGEGKYKGTGAGGFEYSLEPGGPTVGRVGTGLSDEMRRSALQSPGDFVGRVAKIRSQQQLPSGAYRAPSFLALHEDYNGDKLSSVSAYRGVSLDELAELGIVKESDTVVQEVQELVDGDNVFKSFDGGYGYVMWDPVGKRLHLVSGDWYENDDVNEAKALLDNIAGVDEVTCDSEYFERGVAWTKIERDKKPVEIEKPMHLGKESAHAPLDLETIEAGVAEANAVLRQRKDQMAGIIAQLNKARTLSDKGKYKQKQQLLRKLMTQAPQDWVIDQPNAFHPGVTHVPSGYRLHTSRGSIPAKVLAAPVVPSAPPPVVPQALPQVKLAAGSLLEHSIFSTPINYDTGQGIVQNVMGHLGKIRSAFRSNVGGRRYANSYLNAYNPQAQLADLGKMLEGTDPVLHHPYDVMADRFLQ